MRTLIFNLPSSNLYFPSTDLDFQGSKFVNFEAPTSKAPTLYLVQAPTWSLEDSYPLGLQPYLPRHQPFLYEAPTSCFISSRYIWLYFMAPKVFFNEPWQSSAIPSLSLHVTSSMTTLSFSWRCHHCSSSYPNTNLQGYLMMTNASWPSKISPRVSSQVP